MGPNIGLGKRLGPDAGFLEEAVHTGHGQGNGPFALIVQAFNCSLVHQSLRRPIGFGGVADVVQNQDTRAFQRIDDLLFAFHRHGRIGLVAGQTGIDFEWGVRIGQVFDRVGGGIGVAIRQLVGEGVEITAAAFEIIGDEKDIAVPIAGRGLRLVGDGFGDHGFGLGQGVGGHASVRCSSRACYRRR